MKLCGLAGVVALVMGSFCWGADAGQPVLWPAAGAKDVCPDTPLRITFAAAPTLSGQGNIQIMDTASNTPVETIDTSKRTATETVGGFGNFKYYPVVVSGNELTIYPHDHALDYGKSYTVKIDDGVVGSGAADSLGDWKFSTKAAPPVAGSAKLTVAADGSGDFCTVQGAIDFIPDGNTTPTMISIRKGAYHELICFGHKDRLTLRGEDRKGTVIEYPNNDKFDNANTGHVYHRGVFLANRCNDLTLENLTIRNSTPQGGSQAEAIIFNGNTSSRAIVRNVDLYSYQDTLQINGQAYVSNCYIEGDVDFMWGSGPCFFENCQCHAMRSRAYYCQIRNTAKNHGYVYDKCTFDGAPGVKDVYLNRIAPARFPNCEVVLIDCAMTDAVNPAAWLLNGAKGQDPAEVEKLATNVHFWEYNSHSPDGQPVDVSKRLDISRQLVQPADADLISKYSDPAFVLGEGWNPRAAAAQPSN